MNFKKLLLLILIINIFSSHSITIAEDSSDKEVRTAAKVIVGSGVILTSIAIGAFTGGASGISYGLSQGPKIIPGGTGTILGVIFGSILGIIGGGASGLVISAAICYKLNNQKKE